MINGFFDPYVDFPAPYVSAFVQVRTLGTRWALINFLIDTGAGATSAHFRDSVRQLKIAPDMFSDLSRSGRLEQRDGVGGSATYYAVPATYLLIHENASIQRLESELRIAAPSETSESLPSILGWDILQHFTFTTDWRTRVVRLES